MRKKFTMLFAALLACVGVVKAEVTTLPTMSEGENIKWYTIKNTRSTKYANYAGDAVKMTQVATPSLSSLFYFTASDAATVEGFTPVMIHNAVTTNKLADFGSWTEAGIAWFLSEDGQNNPAEGLHITNTAAVGAWNGQAGWNALNDGGSSITNYCALDGGSVFVIEAVDAAKISELVAAYKTNAINALETLGTAVDVVAVENAINAVTVEGGNYGKYLADIDAIVNAAVQYVAFRNSHTDSRANNYLGADMVNSKGNGHATFSHLSDVWSLKYTGQGSFYVYNVNNKVYLDKPSSNGALTEAPNVAYTFELIDENKVEFKSGGQTLHLNNHNTNNVVSTGTFLSNYDNEDAASRWYVETDFASLVATYKNSAITALDGGLPNVCTLLGVDATSLIATTKAAIDAIATTDYPTFAAIDAEFAELANAIAAKDVVFQNSNTEHPNRSEVYLATNMGNDKGCGIKVFDYSAVWSLRHAGGAAFYLYNGLNEVYLGNPSGGGSLTPAPAASYTFEIVDANTKLVELKSGNQTLHVNNNVECTLTSYDNNESASRWYVSTIDITAEIQELITANASNHAEVPALGQYSTAGYNALVAAKSTVKTVEEVDAAIAAFKAAKNLPVFMITGVKDYVVGKSIYDDGVDAPNFKLTNAFDKTMWWALDQTTTTVGVTEKVGIYNVGTGNGFWGASSIKITETNENDGAGIADDGIFLFFTTGNDNPIHYQNTDQVIVRYGSREANSGSAHKFIYIGNSYYLNQLADGVFTAANELADVTVPAFDFGTGVNKYNEASKSALDAAVANRTTVLGKISTADEIAAAKNQLETAIAGVSINQPEAGKFYRLRCAGDGMKYLQSTLDETNENDIRLKVLSGAKSVDATFCYIDGALVSYTTGLYINAYRFNEAGTKSDVVFSEASNGKEGAYNIQVGGRYIYGASDNNKIDSGTGTDGRDGYNWWLEEVNTLPVTIGDAGYATFYAPVAVELPDGVTAHTVTVNGNYATLSEAIDVVPAENGVILAGAAGTYDLAITEADAQTLDGALDGTVADSYVAENAYVLSSNKEGVAGLYKAKLNQQENTAFLNNGFKAYLVVEGAAAPMFSFGRGEGTTGIEDAELTIDNGQLTIYDITGRRVEKMEKGIYIVNGKKVVIK